MNYARIVDGRVAEIIAAPVDMETGEPLALDAIYAPDFLAQIVEDAQGVAVVDGTYAGGKFGPVPEPVALVPTSVTQRQARLALLAAGKLDAVTAAINALPADQKQAAQIEWEFASTVERGSPLVGTLGVALGLNDEALDALFTVAATL